MSATTASTITKATTGTCRRGLAASDPSPMLETNAARTSETWRTEFPIRYVPIATMTSS